MTPLFTPVAFDKSAVNPLLRLSQKGFFATLIMAIFPAQQALAAAGRVEFAIGNTVALAADGSERALLKGSEISAGDIVKTTDGRAQLRFLDGGYISLQPNTEFKVEEYNYAGKADGSELGIFKLIKGGLRAITGSIGKANKQAYRMNTPVATIGIRGTEWLSQYDGQKLLVQVGGGAVFLENGAGNLVIYSGQTAVVNGLNVSPEYSNDPLKVTANAYQKSNNLRFEDVTPAQDNLFVVGDLREDDGINTSLVEGEDLVLDAAYYLRQDLTQDNLLQLANLDAKAEYKGNTSLTFTNANGVAEGDAAVGLYVNFASLNVTSDIKVNFTSGTAIPIGAVLTAKADGGFLQNSAGCPCLGSVVGLSQSTDSNSFVLSQNIPGTTPIQLTTNGSFSPTSVQLGSKINKAEIAFNVNIGGNYNLSAIGNASLVGNIVTTPP